MGGDVGADVGEGEAVGGDEGVSDLCTIAVNCEFAMNQIYDYFPIPC